MSFLDRIRQRFRLMEEEQSRRYGLQEASILRDRRYEQDGLDVAHIRACQEIATWLKEADVNSGKCPNTNSYYYAEAEKRIAGFQWQLYKLNRPFIWLEKKIIEPLDSWSDRANVFQFFSKVSPIIEAIGVLAIPFVIFYYESQREQRQIYFEQQREERQLEFERNLVFAQANVRQQQAVKDYLSQITTIYLDVDQRDVIWQDEELKKLLRASTLALFEELSISEDFQGGSDENSESNFEISEPNSCESDRSNIQVSKFNPDAVVGDRKGEVISFLSELGWIYSSEDGSPLILLNESNLSQADLRRFQLSGVSLRKARLNGADLSRADLRRAFLSRVDLRRANLIGTNLVEVDLRGADLRCADLFGADLFGSDLRGADLRGAYLFEANLDGIDLRGVNLKNADLKGANLMGTQFKGITFCETTMPDGYIENRDCKNN